jgi:hypothetical protein
VLALRAKLIALRALPVKCFLDGIPEDVAVNVETVCAFYTFSMKNLFFCSSGQHSNGPFQWTTVWNARSNMEILNGQLDTSLKL